MAWDDRQTATFVILGFGRRRTNFSNRSKEISALVLLSSDKSHLGVGGGESLGVTVVSLEGISSSREEFRGGIADFIGRICRRAGIWAWPRCLAFA